MVVGGRGWGWGWGVGGGGGGWGGGGVGGGGWGVGGVGVGGGGGGGGGVWGGVSCVLGGRVVRSPPLSYLTVTSSVNLSTRCVRTLRGAATPPSCRRRGATAAGLLFRQAGRVELRGPPGAHARQRDTHTHTHTHMVAQTCQKKERKDTENGHAESRLNHWEKVISKNNC